MKNPIIDDLIKLKLISQSNIKVISNKTRDKKIKVLKDSVSKIIFLEKYVTNRKYYSDLKHNKFIRKNIQLKKISHIKTMHETLRSPKINDDIRRSIQFMRILKNKDILDFGCEWGGFLNNIKNYKSLNGIELNRECIDFIQNNLKKINITNEINNFNKKFDIITMFHVLEHIPNQIDTLKELKSKLKYNGKLIIEIPHAEDFLILQDELKEFKDFTFWSEHLILHTYNSLKKVLSKSGFKNIKIQYYQRYNFSNHLGWFLNRKPGGHNIYEKKISKKLNQQYNENLIKLKQTDTLIAIAD